MGRRCARFQPAEVRRWCCESGETPPPPERFPSFRAGTSNVHRPELRDVGIQDGVGALASELLVYSVC
ncbi:unnamed protein product [Linum tenue]|uniref:Uncharacterized protein n=1 Tax=Linum tenue TaxID=586396 RepID=A0AAV0PH05_9ROSI|nr:unnamed protein product [Linum tenue]